MSERMTREQALERVDHTWRGHPQGTSVRASYADLLLAVQAETTGRVAEEWSEHVQSLERQVENLKTDCETAEQRVVAKFLDLIEDYGDDVLKLEIRAAFPAQEAER